MGKRPTGSAGLSEPVGREPFGAAPPATQVTVAPGGLPRHCQESWVVDTNWPGISCPLVRNSVYAQYSMPGFSGASGRSLYGGVVPRCTAVGSSSVAGL